MRKPRVRWAAVVPLIGIGVLLGPSSGGPVGAEQLDPAVSYEAWFFRAKPAQQQVDVPCSPAPAQCGPVSPGDVAPAPQAPEGGFVTSFAGGTPGDSDTGGDTGWAAFQWDLFDAAGGTVEEFVVTLTQSPDNRGDVRADVAPIQACNIVAPWAGAPTANAWDQRPTADCASAVRPTLEEQEGRLTYTFDLTTFAQTWADGAGYGVVILPGTAEATSPLPPFQVTFAGYGNQADEDVRELVKPRVTFRFTAGAGDPLTEGSAGAAAFDAETFDSGGALGSSVDSGSFSSDSLTTPNLDVFPDDVGSTADTGSAAVAAPAGSGGTGTASPPLRPASAETGFPASLLLLAPLAVVAFFGLGTALGPAGDPLLPREGGVSRVLAERRALGTNGGPASTPTDEKG